MTKEIAKCPDCGFITVKGEDCWACEIRHGHDPGCPMRKAATCSTPVECEHGRDVCPECDPCTCD